MKKLLALLLWTCFCTWIFMGYVFPMVIDNRAAALGLLGYDSKTDKMIIKDTVTITNADLYYIKFGKMGGYK